MPWNECHVVDDRLRFVARVLDGEKMAPRTPLCREFGIGDAADRSVIEILDSAQFVRRVRAGLPWRWADTLIHDTVRYWSPANPPEAVWALPQMLTMHKRRDRYEHQQEYRLAFGIWRSVFDFENVELLIVDKDTRGPRSRLNEQHHRKKLRLGGLEDCCRLRLR
jgi:hypothetical protein